MLSQQKNLKQFETSIAEATMTALVKCGYRYKDTIGVGGFGIVYLC